MGRKKLILVVFEGNTDVRALSSVIKKTMDKKSFEFECIKGNLFTDWDIQNKDVKKALDDRIEEFLAKNPQFKNQIDCYIQVTDTDGCFLRPQYIEECQEQDSLYTEEKIVTNRRNEYIARNIKASQRMYYMANLKIYRKKPYFLLYMSREQEHVLHNRIEKLTVEEKLDLANQFRKTYKGREQDFKEFICNSSFAVQGNYKETWEFIRKDNHSLKRYSNFHLIYEIVQEI